MKTLITLFATVSVLLLQAQFTTLPLWPNGIPNQKIIEPEERDTASIIKISNVHEPDIAVYLPAKANANGQAVIICPGGGYYILAYDWEGTDMAKWLNSKGVAAVVLKYRLPTAQNVSHDAPLADAKQAVRMTRHHAEKWNIDPHKIGVMGFSAGGHLAATLGTQYDLGIPESNDPIQRLSSRPDFLILVYAAISVSNKEIYPEPREQILGEKNMSDELKTFYSGELNVTPETPPTILIHAFDDKGVPIKHSILFMEALKKNNVPGEMHIYPDGGHGFSLATKNEHLRTWTDRVDDFMMWLDRREQTE